MTFGALFAKDLRVEWRSRDTFAAGLTVALLIALVGNVAFADHADVVRGVAGVLWMAIVFGAQVGLARAFVVERERGTLDGVLASPTSAFSIWASKLVVHTIVLMLLGVLTLFAILLFFRLGPALVSAPLALLLVLGVIGVALVTTTTAALAMHGANWILVVPLLSLPLLFAVIAAAVPGTHLALQGATLVELVPHLRVIAAFDIVMATAAWLLVPYVLEP